MDKRTINRSAGVVRSPGRVIERLAGPLLVTFAMLPATFLVPVIDSTRAPYFDLTSSFATVSYWVAQSGGPVGAAIVGMAMVLLLVTRSGISGRRRIQESIVVLIVVAIFAGGGAAFNEHVVKPLFHVPRPNIASLAGTDGTGPLGMSTEEFYGTGDKQDRRVPFRRVLEAQPAPVPLSPEIREHWIEETGYSFPSGHAFAAMFLATFYLALGISYVSETRLRLFYLLLPWAVAVCYSRPILRVHTPTDITVGGLEGLVLGLAAFVAVRRALSSGEETVSPGDSSAAGR